MFVKLLKQEWRANRGLVGMLCAIIGISALLLGGSMRYITWSAVTGNQGMVSAYSVVLTAAVVTILVCCMLAMYFLAYRFYKSRFTDQGYLMLTLPVTSHAHLLSGIVMTVIGVVLVALTAVVSVTVAMGVYLTIFQEPDAAHLWKTFVDGWVELAETHGFENVPVILRITELVITILANLILFMLALTIGAQSYKHPVLEGALVYIGADFLVGKGCELLGKLLDNPVLHTALSCLIYGILAVVAYVTMHHILDKRINLT